jgi:hypothetical protein
VSSNKQNKIQNHSLNLQKYLISFTYTSKLIQCFQKTKSALMTKWWCEMVRSGRKHHKLVHEVRIQWETRVLVVRSEIFTVVKSHVFRVKMTAAWFSEMLVSHHITCGITNQKTKTWQLLLCRHTPVNQTLRRWVTELHTWLLKISYEFSVNKVSNLHNSPMTSATFTSLFPHCSWN